MKALIMPKSPDWYLPILAIFSLFIGYLSFKFDQKLPPTVWEGRDLLSGFDPARLTKIKISSSNNSFSLLKEGNRFVIDSLDMAPADPLKVNELLLRLGGIQIDSVLGNERDWSSFGVDDKEPKLRVDFFEQSDRPRWNVYIGNNQSLKNGSALRLSGQNEVFLSKEYLSINSSAQDYLEKTVLRFSREKFQQVEILINDKQLVETKFKSDDLWQWLKEIKVKRHIRSGREDEDLEKVKWEYMIRLFTQEGISYVIQLAKNSQKWYMKASAQMNQTLSSSGPLLDVKQLAVKSTVDQFNQSKLPWIWELDDSSISLINPIFSPGSK